MWFTDLNKGMLNHRPQKATTRLQDRKNGNPFYTPLRIMGIDDVESKDPKHEPSGVLQ